MISKLIHISDKKWVQLTEFPDGTLNLGGIQEHPEEPRAYLINSLRFSREALTVMLPHIQKWLKEG